MFTRLKICGITNLPDALMCVQHGVDFLGFNFYPESSRYISFEKTRKIIEHLPFYCQTVGILVRPTLAEIRRAIEESGISAVQVYEPEGDIDFRKVPVPVIFGLRLKLQTGDFTWPEGISMILLDSYSSQQFGGTGKTFDWRLVPPNLPKEKLILAGGIDPENIKMALAETGPAVIDVASGSEKSPGVKDPAKIKKMVQRIMEHNSNVISNESI